ncbi:restriction system protein [Roseomonas rosea]|uniref:Restriction system protein n=1 Tax=Muricoccus roseus TaxID=198092 RepID=A0A1M6R235_9PROT|nr:restriction endonuclease [Roseomonas rosea]SHK26466.1 restriction system protein [Roseomonas rosea]
MARLWLVRAGKNGERETAAISQSVLAPGFIEVADLTPAKDRDAVLVKITEALPSEGLNTRKNFAAQLNQFRNTIAIGDLVVMPRKLTPGVAIGRVTGPYAYSDDPALRHVRSIEWKRVDLPRTAIKQDLRFSLGAFMTICEISRNEALKRIQAVIETGKDPGPSLAIPKPSKPSPVATDEVEDAEDAPTDIEDLANQQLIALIKSEFAGHALAQLVGEILEADGYSVRVSPPGPDNSRDILAADGALGFGERRICVQVKSGDKPADNAVVLSLQGAMTNAKAATGLLVSLSGVTPPAQKILDDNFFTLRLWQMPDLLNALFRTYHRLPDETRARLPLKQIWIPVGRDEGGEA